MKINAYFIQLSVLIMMIFGGTFALTYVRRGDLLLDQMMGASFGIVLLIASLVWRQRHNSVES